MSIQGAFDTAIAHGSIRGAILLASDTSGSFTSSHVLGTRSLPSGQPQPLLASDILCVASASKLLTTIAALQCVQDNLLSLTDDISPLLPELAAKKVLVGYDGDAPVFEERRGTMTLEMLLTHAAGTSLPFSDPNLARWQKENNVFRPGNEGRLSVEEAFVDPLGYQPGSKWMYGFGVDWAGRAVERVTHTPLLAYMKERIFTPLGIRDVSFFPVTDENLQKRQVDRNADDEHATGIAVMGPVGAWGQNFTRGAFGGHGLSMTAEDYLKVLQSLLRNDEVLLNKDVVDNMCADHLHGSSGETYRAQAAHPLIGVHLRAGVAPTRNISFGLGGLVTLDEASEEEEGWRCGKGTLAWGGGYTIAWFVDREKRICGFGAVVSKKEVDLEAVEELKGVFRRGVYDEFEEWKRSV